MDISSKQVNKDFIIRRYPSATGIKDNSLLSYNTLVALVGVELAHKNINKAYQRGQDKHTFKLRRGLKIELASK